MKKLASLLTINEFVPTYGIIMRSILKLLMRPHERHLMVDSKIILKIAGLLQIAGKKMQISFDVEVE